MVSKIKLCFLYSDVDIWTVLFQDESSERIAIIGNATRKITLSFLYIVICLMRKIIPVHFEMIKKIDGNNPHY